MILALGAAILTDAFPPAERGKALGLIGTFVSIGVVTGPLVGGILISRFDWRSIFFVNLPVGIVGMFLVVRNVPATPPRKGQRFDLPGAILLSLALLLLCLGVIGGQGGGYGSAPVVAALIAGASTAVGFVLVERNSPHPMLPIQVFANPLLAASIVTGFLAFSALSATFFLLRFYLEGVLGFDLRTTGMALAVSPLVLGAISPLAGTWSDRIGVRRISLTGLMILTVAYLGFQTFATDTTFLEYAAVAAFVGLGIGMFQSPNNSAIMGSMPREYAGVAGGILTLTRLLGQIGGVAALASLWAARAVANAGPGFAGDAVDAPPNVQVEALHEAGVAMATLVGVAAIVGWYGLRRSKTLPA